jgi:hypothetical protein
VATRTNEEFIGASVDGIAGHIVVGRASQCSGRRLALLAPGRLTALFGVTTSQEVICVSESDESR